ncbi:hypothetical protein Pla22_26440 [Rubripirellula amarantea]|uniref:Glycosyl hydrolase family 71 n=1 Tax=Rubripirellula amarantea TaxID=2527999 RepID=A0A5C5WWS4_9BACT|nr:glycoside hydrolase family 71/99-like protein [Rubripirellula amarantea]TWT54990.1 hypothetical protein Pla22_26440 [Rubripirellula amarantea]
MMIRNLFLFLSLFLCGESFVLAQAVDGDSQAKPLILAHYMPWFSASPRADDSGEMSWGWHWTMNHFDPDQVKGDRRQIASHFYPVIGPYDSADPAVLEYHLLLMKTAGIDGVIVDWYGLEAFNDYPMLHRNTQLLFEAVSKRGMKFAICYEDQTIPIMVRAGRLNESDQVSHAINEINQMQTMWFDHPCYVRVDGKPVLLSFGDSGLTNDGWKECLAGLKHSVAYFSEHTRRDGAMGAYDWPVPSMGFKASDRFETLAKSWEYAIPVAFPRFVDCYAEGNAGDGYQHIDDWGGETFKRTLVTASKFNAPMIQLATWNDWGEGTQIEPSREHGFRDLEMIQMFRRRYVDKKFAAKADDLQLPLELWKQRQDAAADDGRLTEVADLIADGEFARARKRLESRR